MLAITRRPPLTRRALPVGYACARSRAAGRNRRQLAPRRRRAQREAVRLAPRSASRTAARPAARFSARLATGCLGRASDRQDVERPSRSRAAVALVVARDAHAVAALGRAPRPARVVLEVVVDAAGRLAAP